MAPVEEAGSGRGSVRRMPIQRQWVCQRLAATFTIVQPVFGTPVEFGVLYARHGRAHHLPQARPRSAADSIGHKLMTGSDRSLRTLLAQAADWASEHAWNARAGNEN